jgi:DNA-binding NarL/FixJ family response regulator
VSELGVHPPAYLRLLTPSEDREQARLKALDNGTSAQPAPAEASIRVLIAACQTLTRASYRVLLQRDEGIEVVGEAATEEQAVALATDTEPDVALLDAGLSGRDDIATMAGIVSHPAFARVAVMLIADPDQEQRVLNAVRAGAVGVLSRDAEPAELTGAVRLLARGGAHLPAGVLRSLLAGLPPLSRLTHPPRQLEELTDREREVLALAATGLTNREIAVELVISPATAKTHVSRVMIKLHAHDRAKLVVLAYAAGLVSPNTWSPVG